jgi:hypothetical protein
MLSRRPYSQDGTNTGRPVLCDWSAPLTRQRSGETVIQMGNSRYARSWSKWETSTNIPANGSAIKPQIIIPRKTITNDFLLTGLTPEKSQSDRSRRDMSRRSFSTIGSRPSSSLSSRHNEPHMTAMALSFCSLIFARRNGAYCSLSYVRNMQFESVSSRDITGTKSNSSI